MKAITLIQRFLALLMMCVGFILTISETPITQGLENQAWITCGGLVLIAICLIWLGLINWEESCFETGKKTFQGRKGNFTETALKS